MKYFSRNDWLTVSPVAIGLQGHYPAAIWQPMCDVLVIALEGGATGTLDVYDVLYREEGDTEYREVSIYGFQVETIRRFSSHYQKEENAHEDDEVEDWPEEDKVIL